MLQSTECWETAAKVRRDTVANADVGTRKGCTVSNVESSCAPALIVVSAVITRSSHSFSINGQALQERRHIRLERVHTQLRELHGPLHFWVDVSERVGNH